VGLTVGMDVVAHRKISTSAGNRTPAIQRSKN